MHQLSASFNEKDEFIKDLAEYYCENSGSFNIDEFLKIFHELSLNIQRIIKVCSILVLHYVFFLNYNVIKNFRKMTNAK